jgi:hypothetical protein
MDHYLHPSPRWLSYWLRVLGPLLWLTVVLAGCATSAKHTPHIVGQINQRAATIAQQSAGLRPQVVSLALKAYNQAQAAGFGNKHLLTIIDYSLPSTVNRLWIINLNNNRVLFSERVAHGIASGQLYATRFSDRIDSRQSSIGMYLTAAEGYRGRHGYALRLHGLEPGFNDNAYTRNIVLHSAAYVSDAYIVSHGYLGQTWGCPAINSRHLRAIITTLKGGTLIFAYGNDSAWLKQSRFLAKS